MLLTLTNTAEPATDLGYLLHKHPDRVHSANLTFGKAHVFYPEALPHRCTAALLVEVDPIGLVRGRRGPAGEGRTLEHYVNDRPYVGSSFLSVALADVFSTALSGRCKDRPELVTTELPLEAAISVLPCRGGEGFLRRLFEPLGYEVEATQHPLDETNESWGPSRYFSVKLKARKKLSDLLTHLYVLIPVLDDDKHYWVGDDEVDKLVRRGEGWLATHPEREMIAKRYLKHQHSLAREALEQILADEIPAADEIAEAHEREEAEIEKKISLQQQRIAVVLAALKQSGAKRVLDLGCGEGQLVRALLGEKSFEEIVAVDVSHRALEIAAERLHVERMSEKQKARLKLLHGSLMYRDKRLAGYDAAAVVEVIEHLDPPRLAAFERVVFDFARPGTVIVTTPNVEYNSKFDNLPAGRMRHHDHRFEWTRAEFQSWAEKMAERFRYRVRFLPIGPEDVSVGAPTQMAVFSL
jgi:3' terminal RNA ribose 2'-O-methyltransferase Hen1